MTEDPFPGVAAWAGPGAPEGRRLAAARGAVPMPPADLLELLHRLARDPSGKVRDEAVRTWDSLPDRVFLQALSDRRLSPGVLDRIAATRGGSRALCLKVLEHPAVGARTLARFAGSPDPEVLERVARNQRVLLQASEVIDAVLANPRLPAAERSHLAAVAGREEAVEEAPPEEDLPDLPPDLPPELLDDDQEPVQAEPENLYRLVRSMSVAEKIRLAMLGSKSARRLLVRDTNKAVVRAVVQSPKIREDEVLAIAQDRTVSEEIIRMIVQRRDWLKSYPIRLALCQNPKTPLPRALRLLETLQERDLRQISKSRNVPSPVSSGAVRVLARRKKL